MEDLENNPPLQKMILADTSYKLCQALHIRGLCLEEARVRIAQVLLYLCEKFGQVIPETRATIAEVRAPSSSRSWAASACPSRSAAVISLP